MSNNLVVPANISILPLPPKSPELNPVENLWLFMRENWLSNRVFKSYDESLGNLTPADVYFGRGQTILLERERIKRDTISSLP